MKKKTAIFSTIIMTTLTSCSLLGEPGKQDSKVTPCQNHIDRDDNGICDVCGESIEHPTPGPGDKVLRTIEVGDFEHGSIIPDKYFAYVGETINLTITPEKDYVLKDGSLKYNDTKIEGKSFIMPDENVLITALFEEGDANTYACQVKFYDDGKPYLEANGEPFVIRGAQIRIDGLINRLPENKDKCKPLTNLEIEQYFKTAKESGFNCVEIPLDWKRVETSFDVYDFTLTDVLLSFCNKYDLKCELLWFSTNMCGDGHTFQIPDYIFNDNETYPKYQAVNANYGGMYGQFYYPVLNNPNLMAREAKVLTKIMEHIYEWDRRNGKKSPLIGVQVHNESDGLLRWRLDQKKLKLNGVSVTPEDLWQVTLDALDNAGKAIKSTNYKCYTRCNMTVTTGMGEFPQFPGKGFSPKDVLALDGIDIVGDDPYVTNPVTINKTIRSYTYNDNYPMICENMASYESTPQCIFNAYQAGGCYMIYDLATPEYFIYLNGGNHEGIDQGLFNTDLTPKAHTLKVLSAIKGITLMDQKLASIRSSEFAIFNTSKENKPDNYEGTKCTSKLSITYKTNNGGIAYAITDGDYAYLYSTTESSFIINNATFSYKAEVGYFSKQEYIVEETPIINPEITVEAGKLYRIKIRQINDEVTSNTNEEFTK